MTKATLVRRHIPSLAVAKGFEPLMDGYCLVWGHSVTEDYSSYESVDEEEAPPEKPVKRKGKKVAAPVVVKNEGETDERTAKALAPAKSTSTLKRKPSKPSVQKAGIASYFTKK
jgi:hypothetical protein